MSVHGNVINCKNKGDILASGYYEAGGIVGYSYSNSSIKKCSNYANLETNSENTVGGIAGCTNQCAIEECFNIGNIIGKDFVGGIAGQTNYTTIKNCYNTASITGSTKIGGIVGAILLYEYQGGYEYLYNCYDIGLISANTTIKDCWVGYANYLNYDYIYTIKTIHDQVGNGTWDNELGNKNWGALSGTDTNIKTTMLTNLLNGEGTGKWTRDTKGKINNGYPYLVNNIPE